MKKIVCDICGSEMKNTSFIDAEDNFKELQFCISSYGKIWDVCDECRVSLSKWMKERARND